MSAFDGIWKYARTMKVMSPDSNERHDFKGFLENVNPDGIKKFYRTKTGKISAMKFRLISEPREDFFDGKASGILRGDRSYEILSIKDIYIGDEISHRECILRLSGEGVQDD